MKKYGYALGLLVTIIILTGCSSARIWTSTPAIQSADNQYFATQFEPIRIDGDFINGFRLTVTNKSPQAIIIDWNATLYLLNNKNIGRFIFEGIDEKNVNNLPPDNIATGEYPQERHFSAETDCLAAGAWICESSGLQSRTGPGGPKWYSFGRQE